MTHKKRPARGMERPPQPRPAAAPPSDGAKARDPLAATPDKMLPFLRALAGDAEARLRAVLGVPAAPRSVLSAASAAHRQYDETWGYVQSLNVVQHACRAGCDHCCSLTVEASAPEVFLIAEHLRATHPPERLEAVRERLSRTAALVQGLTPAERVRAAVPCALLEQGRCSAHAVRPLACRSWNSRDAGVCERIMREGGGDLRPVQDQRPVGIGAGIGLGFAEALRRAGLPEDADRRCELNSALRIALGDPQALERWAGGDDTLRPARSAVRYSD